MTSNAGPEQEHRECTDVLRFCSYSLEHTEGPCEPGFRASWPCAYSEHVCRGDLKQSTRTHMLTTLYLVLLTYFVACSVALFPPKHCSARTVAL